MNDTSDHQYTTPTQPNRHASIQDTSDDVPVVSQTQITSMSARTTTSNLSNDDIYSSLYHDDNNGYQSPDVDDTSPIVVPHNLIPSPNLDRHQIITNTNMSEHNTSELRSRQDDGRKGLTKKRKVTYSIDKPLRFHILRQPYINSVVY